MENVHFGSDLDLINSPGEHTGMFVWSDPVVHNHVFGLARFDLTTKQHGLQSHWTGSGRHGGH